MTKKKKKTHLPNPPLTKFARVVEAARSSSRVPSLSGESNPGSSSTASPIVDLESCKDIVSPRFEASRNSDLGQSSPSGTGSNPECDNLSAKNSEMAEVPSVPQTTPVTVINMTSTSTGASPGTESPTVKQQVPVRKWSSIVSDSANLEEIGTPSQHVSGVPFVLIPDENIEAAKEEFKDFIFARFHGDAPEMGRVIGVVNAIWARTGPRIFVHKIGPGTYLLKVVNEKTRAIMLSRNMWNIAGFPMFVASWSPEFNSAESPITSAVVPVEFREVPYLLFNKESLSRIATAVGKPVTLAPETERKENFEVARIYICVNLTKELPPKVISGFTNGREAHISVTYPWLPVKCDDCRKYGHKTENCSAGNNLQNPVFQQRRRQQSPGPYRGIKPRLGSSKMRHSTPVEGISKSPAQTEKVAAQDNLEIENSPDLGGKIEPVHEVDKGSKQSADKDESGSTISGAKQEGKSTIFENPNKDKEERDYSLKVKDGELESEAGKGTGALSDLCILDKAVDLVSLASITVLENMSVFAPTVVTIIESPSESAKNESVLHGSKPQPISAAKTVSTTVVEPDFGSNKFASLISPEEEELISPEEEEVFSDSDREIEMDSMDIMTPSGKRILRERPVKPTAKAKEMYWQSAARGRGRGRGKRGGRG